MSNLNFDPESIRPHLEALIDHLTGEFEQEDRTTQLAKNLTVRERLLIKEAATSAYMLGYTDHHDRKSPEGDDLHLFQRTVNQCLDSPSTFKEICTSKAESTAAEVRNVELAQQLQQARAEIARLRAKTRGW